MKSRTANASRRRFRAEYHERSAHGFLDALSPVDGIPAALGNPDGLIYRGHGSSRYGLISSAHRGRRAVFFDQRPAGRRTVGCQIQSEIVNLLEFWKLANVRGLRIPEDTQQLRRVLKRCVQDEFFEELASGKAVWPPDEVLSVLALAQHYGMPTRLLDWSLHPYVAAYFAAVNALDHPHAGNLAVWAFDRSVFDYALYPWLEERVRVVTAPAADNPNLFAQQGLFLTLVDTKIARAAPFRSQAFDELIIDQIGFDLPRQLFYHFTLPAKQAPELLQALFERGIDASYVFPGYVGIVQAIKERLRRSRGGSASVARARQAVLRRYHAVLERWRRDAAG